MARISRALDIPIELGGGVRDEDAARMWFDAGVARLIIGTMALEKPREYARLCSLFPGKIGVSLDAVDGRLKTRGWVTDAGLTVDEVMPRLVGDGTAFIIYTDIARDGMQSGVNMPMLSRLAHASPVPVVAAGGVATLDDIKKLYPLSVEANLQGANLRTRHLRRNAESARGHGLDQGPEGLSLSLPDKPAFAGMRAFFGRA